MDHSKNVESALNALLLNASDLKNTADDPILSATLFDEQKQLLDALFYSWQELSDQDKKVLLAAKVETKVHALAQKNQECLRLIKSEFAEGSF